VTIHHRAPTLLRRNIVHYPTAKEKVQVDDGLSVGVFPDEKEIPLIIHMSSLVSTRNSCGAILKVHFIGYGRAGRYSFYWNPTRGVPEIRTRSVPHSGALGAWAFVMYDICFPEYAMRSIAHDFCILIFPFLGPWVQRMVATRSGCGPSMVRLDGALDPVSVSNDNDTTKEPQYLRHSAWGHSMAVEWMLVMATTDEKERMVVVDVCMLLLFALVPILIVVLPVPSSSNYCRQCIFTQKMFPLIIQYKHKD
jgi:hypothetical protein